MKILHVCIADHGGGAAIAANRLHQAMNQSGKVSSHMLVAFKSPASANVSEIDPFRKSLVRLSNMTNRFLSWGQREVGLFSHGLTGANAICKHKRFVDASVVYLHWANNGLVSRSEIARILKTGKNVVLFAHDMWYFTGGCHQSNGCTSFALGCNSCPFFRTKWMQLLVKRNFEYMRSTFQEHLENIRVAIPSNNFLNIASNSAVFNDLKLFCIPNVLDVTTFSPNERDRKRRPIRILFGAMGGPSNPYKGWFDFVYAMKILTLEYGTDLQIDLFGYDFSKRELESLPFECVSHGLVTDVDGLRSIYQSADLFVFPSHQESFGQTLLEAMSCGVVPIAYDVGAAPDLIKHGYNGYIAPVGEKSLIAECVKHYEGTADRKRMHENARLTVMGSFSPEMILEKHFQMIETFGRRFG